MNAVHMNVIKPKKAADAKFLRLSRQHPNHAPRPTRIRILRAMTYGVMYSSGKGWRREKDDAGSADLQGQGA